MSVLNPTQQIKAAIISAACRLCLHRDRLMGVWCLKTREGRSVPISSLEGAEILLVGVRTHDDEIGVQVADVADFSAFMERDRLESTCCDHR